MNWGFDQIPKVDDKFMEDIKITGIDGLPKKSDVTNPLNCFRDFILDSLAITLTNHSLCASPGDKFNLLWKGFTRK